MQKSNTISLLSSKAIGCSIAFFMLISTLTASAQTRGKLTVVKDSRIDSLIALRISLSKAGGSSNSAGVYAPTSAQGYRVQVFTGSNRNEAYNAQSKFNALYPELRTYIIYNEPNFKVRAGDFRSRLEASKLMEQVRSQFSSVFIIPEKINLPKIGTTND